MWVVVACQEKASKVADYLSPESRIWTMGEATEIVKACGANAVITAASKIICQCSWTVVPSLTLLRMGSS